MFLAKIKFQRNKNYKNIEIWDSSTSFKTCTKMNTVHNICFLFYYQALGPNCIRRFKFNNETFNIKTYTEHKHSKFF